MFAVGIKDICRNILVYFIWGYFNLIFGTYNFTGQPSQIDLLKLRHYNICMTLKLNAFTPPLLVEVRLDSQCWNELEEETLWIVKKVTSLLLILFTTLVQRVSNFMWKGFEFLLSQFWMEY